MSFGCVCFGRLYVPKFEVKIIHEFSKEFDMLTLEVKYMKKLRCSKIDITDQKL